MRVCPTRSLSFQGDDLAVNFPMWMDMDQTYAWIWLPKEER